MVVITSSTKSSSTTSVVSLLLMKDKQQNTERRKLPSWFVPSKFAVLCGRGRSCTDSPGNMRLKALIKSNLKQYSKAGTKAAKSEIVSAIMADVKDKAPSGAFVKLDDETGIWYEVEDAYAREVREIDNYCGMLDLESCSLTHEMIISVYRKLDACSVINFILNTSPAPKQSLLARNENSMRTGNAWKPRSHRLLQQPRILPV